MTHALRANGHAIQSRTPAAPGYPPTWRITTVCGLHLTTRDSDIGAIRTLTWPACKRALARHTNPTTTTADSAQHDSTRPWIRRPYARITPTRSREGRGRR